MDLRFDASGLFHLDMIGPKPELATGLTEELRPWRRVISNDDELLPAGIRVRFVDGSPPADGELLGDAGDGRVTSVSEERLVVLARRGWWAIPAGEDGTGLVVSRELPGWSVVGDVVRPAALVAAGRVGGAAVHAATVHLGPDRLLIAGWSESGKTELALAMGEAGFAFVADKWALLTPDGRAVAMPGRIHVRDWVLRWLPKLRASLSRQALLKLRAARIAADIGRPMSRIPGPGAALVGQHWRELAGLAARARIHVDEFNRSMALAPPPPAAAVSHVVLLRRVQAEAVRVRVVRPAHALRSIAVSTAFERRSLRELAERARYAAATPRLTALDDPSMHRSVLKGLIGGAVFLEVQAAFPTDPRRVRDAIIGQLRA